MSDIVGRVARAIGGIPVMCGTYGMSGQDAVALARAAIEAMREPTEDMVGACYTDVALASGKWPGSLNYRPDFIWQTMIDAALAGK